VEGAGFEIPEQNFTGQSVQAPGENSSSLDMCSAAV